MIKAVLLLSIAGIIDSVYLSAKHYTHSDINCSIFDGCEIVTTSVYSTILGIPVALFGVIFYISIFVLSILYLRLKNKKFLISLLGLSSAGFLMSIWFVYTQAFILNAFCFYCLISASLSTILFILSIAMFLAMRKSEKLDMGCPTEQG